MGPESSGTFAVCDLIAIDATEIPAAIPASASQVAIQFHGDVWRAATSAAAIAVMPMTTCPHPDTRGERRRALHHAADEAQVVHRPRLHLGRLGATRRGRRGSDGCHGGVANSRPRHH